MEPAQDSGDPGCLQPSPRPPQGLPLVPPGSPLTLCHVAEWPEGSPEGKCFLEEGGAASRCLPLVPGSSFDSASVFLPVKRAIGRWAWGRTPECTQTS